MALVKLVCQGCGANLDAHDHQRILDCGYCGTTNRLQQTAAPQPQPPPQPPRPQQMPPQPMPVQVQPRAAKSGGGNAALIIVLIAVLLPIGLGGFITYMVFNTVSSTVDKTLEQISSATGRTIGAVTGGGYMWASQRPFLADVDADGSEDIIALIQPVGASVLELAMLSGPSYAQKWSTQLGDRSDLPQVELRVVPEQGIALIVMGASLRAYALTDGSQRWVANLPDKVGAIAMGDAGVVVTSVDDSVSIVALSSGQVSEADDKAANQAKPMRTDTGYDLIPSYRELDLDRRKAFDKLDLERAFCPSEKLVVKDHRRASCTHEHGLAYATRAKGTKVPFLVGYDPGDKSERWRTQLTAAGSLETVGSGFEQPRAEFTAGDAIVSFAPDKEEGARIRRLDAQTGETKWETQLSGDMSPHVNGMVVGSSVVAVSFGQAMYMLSLADGSVQTKLGGF